MGPLARGDHFTFGEMTKDLLQSSGCAQSQIDDLGDKVYGMWSEAEDDKILQVIADTGLIQTNFRNLFMMLLNQEGMALCPE
jgi:hypothetical protein